MHNEDNCLSQIVASLTHSRALRVGARYFFNKGDVPLGHFHEHCSELHNFVIRISSFVRHSDFAIRH
jgi:hypothetical protein